MTNLHRLSNRSRRILSVLRLHKRIFFQLELSMRLSELLLIFLFFLELAQVDWRKSIQARLFQFHSFLGSPGFWKHSHLGIIPHCCYSALFLHRVLNSFKWILDLSTLLTINWILSLVFPLPLCSCERFVYFLCYFRFLTLKKWLSGFQRCLCLYFIE